MLYPLSKRVKTMLAPSGEKAGFWALAPDGGVNRRIAPSGRVSLCRDGDETNGGVVVGAGMGSAQPS
jgi:hypothetical protein